MYRRAHAERLADLKYALRVMGEGSHLGMDDHTANRIRRILLRRIAKVENALICESDESISTAFPISEVLEE
jgi:hypothetical protein